MSSLKTRLIDLASDLFSVETAVLIEDKNKRFVSAYAHSQIEGDTLVYVDQNHQSDPEIVKTAIQTSIHSRYALVHILTEALK